MQRMSKNVFQNWKFLALVCRIKDLRNAIVHQVQLKCNHFHAPTITQRTYYLSRHRKVLYNKPGIYFGVG